MLRDMFIAVNIILEKKNKYPKSSVYTPILRNNETLDRVWFSDEELVPHAQSPGLDAEL